MSLYESIKSNLKDLVLKEAEESNVDLDKVVDSIKKQYVENYRKSMLKYFNKEATTEFPDYWKIETYPEDAYLIIDIPWGDWKHDHAYCDELVHQVANNLGLDCIGGEDDAYDENGSDGYSATHSFEFSPKDNSMNESELQSLFDFITDEARKHNNYAHYSRREIDDQEINELIKDCKKKGREIEPNKYVVDDFIYTIDKSGITVSENNIDDYKVIRINEAEKSWEDKCKYIFNKYRDEFDTINEVRDISDYLNRLYSEQGIQAVNDWFLPGASEEYKKDFKSLINKK